jgi:predicted NodU family carbamoyl transferase
MPAQIEKGNRDTAFLRTTARPFRLIIARARPTSELGIPKLRHFDFPQRQQFPHRLLYLQNDD